MILHSLLPTSAPGIPELVEATASCPSLPSLPAETGLLLIHSLTLHALPTLLLSLLGSQSTLSDGSFPKEEYGCGSRTLQLLPRPSGPPWGNLGRHLEPSLLVPALPPSTPALPGSETSLRFPFGPLSAASYHVHQHLPPLTF